MRLDKYLKISRIIKRRTLAKEIIDIGLVKINGRTAKPSGEVQTGDVLELALGNRTLKVEVLSVGKTDDKKKAAEMYRILEDKVMNAPL